MDKDKQLVKIENAKRLLATARKELIECDGRGFIEDAIQQIGDVLESLEEYMSED